MKDNNIACNQEEGPSVTVLPSRNSKPHEGDGLAEPHFSKAEAARKIQQSIAYMLVHLNQTLQVAKLAQLADISQPYFFVLFKRWSGCSPIRYFIRLRMQRAGRLLTATTMSVKELAAALGYGDHFYFSRVFKSVHGMAPRDYRVMHYRLALEQLAQTDTQEGMLGLKEDEPQIPIADPSATISKSEVYLQ